jgi:hypothetical protein
MNGWRGKLGKSVVKTPFDLKKNRIGGVLLKGEPRRYC